MNVRRCLRSRWKADLRWFLACCLAGQLALIVVTDWRLPKVYDEEYGERLDLLKERLGAEPERPLLLALGSSRIGLGFLPKELPPLRTAVGELVLPFNFSHLAAGPIMNLMEMHRLLREGARPRWVLLEIVPPCLTHESYGMPTTMATAADALVLQDYFPPLKVWGIYLRCRLNPWYRNRLGLLRAPLPEWVTQVSPKDNVTLDELGGDRDWCLESDIDAPERARRIGVVRSVYFDKLQHYHIDPACDRATRELLHLCRAHGIQVLLLLPPEASSFRGWYSADAARCVDRYCADLCREYDVALVDARTWLGDDAFTDGHHLLRRGAVAFTRRLGREALQPFVAGKFSSTP
jgi:hypothetical protein